MAEPQHRRAGVDVSRQARFTYYGVAVVGSGLATAVVLGVRDVEAIVVFLLYLLPLLAFTPLALLALFEGPVLLTESGLRRRRGNIAWSEVQEAHYAAPYLVLVTPRGKVRVFVGGKKEIMQVISEWNWRRLRRETTAEHPLGYRDGPRDSALNVRVAEEHESEERAEPETTEQRKRVL